MNRIQWIGRHEGLLRDVARGCAYGDPLSLKQCARILAPFIDDGSVLVPMPSHIGYATTMLSLCREIRRYTSKCRVIDCLKCYPHESSHVAKLHNGIAPEIHMYKSGERGRICDGSAMIYVIDNTVATGATASAALEAIKYDANKMVLALTKG